MWTLGLALAAQESELLWPSGPPGALGDTEKDKPTLTAYPLPGKKTTEQGVVVCPGGGYGMLAVGHEGLDVSQWLNTSGAAAFVLRYRLGPRYHHPSPLQDAQRAIRMVRAKGFKTVGIIGFSAGGHLASTAGTHFDDGDPTAADPVEKQSSRPDFMILVYPVISMQDGVGHAGSKRNLLGANPDPKLVELLSNERQVTAKTPPAFLVHSTTDKGVKIENSRWFAEACKKNRVPVELLEFDVGAHGYGLAPKDPTLSTWPSKCLDWLRRQGLLR